jgi:hypothetical protein
MVDKANEAITAVERAQSSAFKSGNERAEAMLRLQKELLDTCEQASRDWLTRLKSETELWSGLATKLAETRSVPTEGLRRDQRLWPGSRDQASLSHGSFGDRGP